MADDTNNTLDDAFKAALYWGKKTPNVERQLANLLADARKFQIDPFVRSICNQLFDHTEPEKLTGWQAELLIEATSELVYSAKSQQETSS